VWGWLVATSAADPHHATTQAAAESGSSYRAMILLSVIPAFFAAGAIVFLVSETPHREPERRPFLQSFTGLGGPFKEFLLAVGLFGLGDFADTFYTLYAMRALEPSVGHDAAFATAVGF